MSIICEIKDGVKYYRLNGVLHNETGPAIQYPNNNVDYYRCEHYRNGIRHRDGNLPAVYDERGLSVYFVNGVLHREVGPAVTLQDGSMYWCINGKLHRPGDDPAFMRGDGMIKWYNNGVLHRQTYPAVISNYGYRWYQNGLLHREGGPAVEQFDGYQEIWRNGVFIESRDGEPRNLHIIEKDDFNEIDEIERLIAK